MKVGDVIQDDNRNRNRKGIIIAIDEKNNYCVLSFAFGVSSWLSSAYMKKCKVIG